ncbi:hypothetical protein BACFIN_05369 [Bacteroides finegoldii DSM 17565]|nr:hypothetical protein BACFIN_05369 [Bacteroides finegoldii DSM 17565]
MKSQSPLLGSNSIVTTLMNQTVLVDFSWSKIQILFDIAIYIDWRLLVTLNTFAYFRRKDIPQ